MSGYKVVQTHWLLKSLNRDVAVFKTWMGARWHKWLYYDIGANHIWKAHFIWRIEKCK